MRCTRTKWPCIGRAGAGLALLVTAITATTSSPAARADLLIELDRAELQAVRILVRPPRARLESADGSYRLYDADMDAMVTVQPGRGVFYEEEPEALARATRRFVQGLRNDRQAIEHQIDDAPEEVQTRWRDMVKRWKLDEDVTAPLLPSIRIDAIEFQKKEARAGGFHCQMARITLEESEDVMQACLTSPAKVGASGADLETLAGMFAYLERLRVAAGPPPADMPDVSPGLIAQLMNRTERFVLGAARWRDKTGTSWAVSDLWSAELSGSHFSVADESRQINAPYSR